MHMKHLAKAGRVIVIDENQTAIFKTVSINSLLKECETVIKRQFQIG